MTRFFGITIIFICINSYSQSIIFPKFKNDYNSTKNDISKNISLKEKDLLVSVFYQHGGLNLTQIKHYVINEGKLKKIFTENQSLYNKKLIKLSEELVTEKDIEKIKSFSKSNFLKSDNSFLNPPKTCIVFDADTRGFIFTTKTSQSSYFITGADHKYKNCKGFDKTALKEFMDSFAIFEIDPNKYTAQFIKINN